MKAEKQYIDFYQTYKEMIGKHCATPLNALRQQSFEAFQTLGFPAYGLEDYQHTNIDEILSPDYGININKVNIPTDPYNVFRCDVPNLSTCLFFLINDRFYTNEVAKSKLPENVFVGGLNEFALTCPEVFAKYYGSLAPIEKDGLAAFNTMLVQDGYVLYVPKNIIIEKPIQLINILTGNVDSLVNRRFLVILEEGAQANLLICDHTSDENSTFAVTQVAEIFVEKNAILDYYELEESSNKTYKLSSNFIRQYANSNIMVNGFSLTNGKTRNNYNISLEGENCETRLYGMVIADEKQEVDNHTIIEHKAAHCHSTEMFKYVLDHEAVGTFSGKIIVDKGAQKTVAYQNNRNLCISRESRMYAKPQLEIYADDVKCSHGFTTGQLDESSLFYMRSRGIPEKEARMLLKFAFANDIIEGIRLDALKDRLRLLIEKRFRGELAKCKDCGKC